MPTTAFGCLSLRQKRDPARLHIAGQGDQVVVIRKRWLQGSAKGAYRRAVKQALLVGAAQLRLIDLQNSVRAGAGDAREEEELIGCRRQLADLLSGRTGVPSLPPAALLPPPGAGEGGRKHLLVKYGARLHGKQARGFAIEGHQLLVFKTQDAGAKIDHQYNLQDAVCRLERRGGDHAEHPPFEAGHDYRLRLTCPQRETGPLFLYAPGPKVAASWIRKIKVAKFHASSSDRLALSTCMRRASRAARCKGWEALVDCAAFVAETRHAVFHCLSIMEHSDLSRGWTKLHLVRRKRMQQVTDHAERVKQVARQAVLALTTSIKSAAASRSRSPTRENLAATRARIISDIQAAYRAMRQRWVEAGRGLPSPDDAPLRAARRPAIMGAAFQPLTCSDVLDLSIPEKNDLAALRAVPEVFRRSQGLSYSDKPMQARASQVAVSSCLTMLVFSDEAPTAAKLPGASWLHFVRLGQISAVVLNGEPPAGAPALAQGSWLTVHGPRVCWGRRARDDILAAAGVASTSVVGGADPAELASAAIRGAGTWLRLTVTITDVLLPRGGGGGEGEPPGAVRFVAHLFGRRFAGPASSQGAEGLRSLVFEASVPVPRDRGALESYDDVELFLRVADANSGATRWAARVPLWRLVADFSRATPEQAALKISLAASLQQGAREATLRVPLARPGTWAPPPPIPGSPSNGLVTATVGTAVVARLEDRPATTSASDWRPCVSPELIGCGPVLALFTSWRGAWCHPTAGKGAFQADRAPSFAIIDFGALRFPDIDRPAASDDTGGEPPPPPLQYHIEAHCPGSSAATTTRWRPEQGWSLVVPMDTQHMSFAGTSVILPLPPGFWCNAVWQKQVRIVVCRRAHVEGAEGAALSYAELLAAGGKQRARAPEREEVFHAVLRLDGLALDSPASDVRIPMVPVEGAPVEVGFRRGEQPPAGPPEAAILILTKVAVRDRDFAAGVAADGASASGRPLGLCVGDRVILGLQEPLDYPTSREQFKQELRPGRWDPQAVGRAEHARLRDPYLPYELEVSGLRDLAGHPPIELKNIPTAANPVPHKFVLPHSEKDFRERHFPTLYRSVVAAMAAKAASMGLVSGGGKPAPVVVDRLPHVLRHAACTLLAVYADRTCDLELSGGFLRRWQEAPARRLLIPGNVLVGRGPDGPRVVLRGVPLSSVSGAQMTGFNIYDAALASTSDALAAEPAGAHAVAAGALPPDASPAACRYEWTLHLCAATAEAAHRLVRLLQYCAREECAQRLVGPHPRALPHAADGARVSSPPRSPSPVRRFVPGSGRLEVLLVEARRLRPRRQRAGADPLDALLAGAAPADQLGALLADTELNVFVHCRVLQGGIPLLVRGSPVQTSPTIHGTDNPDWSAIEELSSAGGWTFRTPTFVPERMPDLALEIEVCHQGIAQEYILGSIRLPVTKGAFLTNLNAPLRNLWLPLTISDADGRRTVSPHGDLHLLTLWLPAVAEGEPAAGRPSPRARLLEEWRPAAGARSVLEPVYLTEAPMPPYNPNCYKAAGQPLRPFREVLAWRAVRLQDAYAYLECCEQRQIRAWGEFHQVLGREGLAGARLGELRLLWLSKGGENRLAAADALVHAGIPGALRRRLWPGLCLSGRVAGDSGEADYALLRARGAAMDCTASAQLREDAVALIASEASTDVGDFVRLHARLESAKRVCFALIAFCAQPSPNGQQAHVPNCRQEREGKGLHGTPVAYCKSLLVLAFHLSLPQRRDQISSGLTEADAFWLLYTLAGSRTNGAFRDYYEAEAAAATPDPAVVPAPRGWKCGALEDVYLLDCALAVHEPELWAFLAACGFQLASIFYGAFMVLFARLIPTASLFRLWDLVLWESSNPAAVPHARHTLVDFAFAVVRGSRIALLRAESAQEAHDLLLNALSELYDPEHVVGLVAEGGECLWRGYTKGQVLKMWQQGIQGYSRFSEQYAFQGQVIEELAHAAPGEDPMEGAVDRRAISTRDVHEVVAPELESGFTETQGATPSGGMFRAVPEDVLDLGAPLETGSVTQVLRQLGAAGTVGTVAASTMGFSGDVPAIEFETPARLAPCPAGVRPQPVIPGEAAWTDVVWRLRPTWGAVAAATYAAFRSTWEDILSLNELLVALICASRGTVVEKAIALFELYAHEEPLLRGQHGLWHRFPPSPLTRPIVRRDHPKEPNRFVYTTALPAQHLKQGVALHLQVWTDHGRPGTLVGEAVVPSLAPFVTRAGREVEPLRFSVWAPVSRNPSKSAACVGELLLTLKWVPSPGAADVGQLSLRLHSACFFSMPPQDVRSLRPRVTVLTHAIDAPMHAFVTDDGTDAELFAGIPIPRDTGVEGSDAVIEFPSSGTSAADGGGWDADVGEWRWPASVGEQRSPPNLAIDSGYVVAPAGRNAISVQASRLVFETVLRRSFCPLSNRQTRLLADFTFSRAGAVPGILAAIIVPDDQEGTSVPTVAEVRRFGGRHAVVTRHVARELERQVSSRVGRMALRLNGLSLKVLRVRDPYPYARKLLLVRFVRAGSGERGNAAFSIGPGGDFVGPEAQLSLDLDRPLTALGSQSLTKAEFVSSVLQSPLMSECLRRTSPTTEAGEPAVYLALDVAVVTTEWPQAAQREVPGGGAPAELPVLFGSQGSPSPTGGAGAVGQGAPQDGRGHGLEVYFTDTIHDFAAKVALACARLAAQWEAVGGEEAAAWAARYLEAQSCTTHTVFALSPASEDQVDFGDPVNWIPLDPVCTFADYAQEFGFGFKSGRYLPLLKVAKPSRSMRLCSHHYRQYVQEREASELRLTDYRSEGRMSAFARFTHAADGGSTEWRPCLVSNSGDGDQAMWNHSGPPKYQASWALTGPSAKEEDVAGAAPFQVEANGLLPAGPRGPLAR